MHHPDDHIRFREESDATLLEQTNLLSDGYATRQCHTNAPPDLEQQKSCNYSVGTKRLSEQTVLELAEACLGHSYLIFLLADLRLLSATGRIATPYQAVTLDSDTYPKLSAAQLSCEESFDSTSDHGLIPAHILAVLLLEITNEADAYLSFDGAHLVRQDVHASKEAEKRAGYYQRCQKDFAQDLPLIPIREKWDDVLHLEDASGIMRQETDGVIEEKGESEALLKMPPLVRKRIYDFRHRKNLKQVKKTYETFSTSFHKLPQDEHGRLEEGHYYGYDEVVRLLRYAATHKHEDIVSEIVPSVFRPNTVSHVMAKSTFEVFWLHDWHPTKECTYAISLDRTKQMVMLVFRGAITRADWGHAFETNHIAVRNPIKKDYPNKTQSIRLHSGFHRYLFRKRRDTGTDKYTEIANRLAYYAEKGRPDCRVVVCGHSLGAALATIFSFYASTDDRLTKNGPVEAVTFGGPWVGGYQFADAFRYQEDTGKLRLARIHNVRDGVPYVPPTLFRMSKRGAAVYHVGMEIELPLIRKGIFKILGQPRPRIKYHGPEPFVRSYLRQWSNFYFFNLPIRPWLLTQVHTLEEHQKRLLLVDSTLMQCTLEELYERRHALLRKTR